MPQNWTKIKRNNLKRVLCTPIISIVKNVHSWNYRPYLIKKNKANTKIVEIQEQRTVSWASYPGNTLNPSHWTLLLEKGIFGGFFMLEDRISMNKLHFLPFNSSPSHLLIVSSSIHFPLSSFHVWCRGGR